MEASSFFRDMIEEKVGPNPNAVAMLSVLTLNEVKLATKSTDLKIGRLDKFPKAPE